MVTTFLLLNKQKTQELHKVGSWAAWLCSFAFCLTFLVGSAGGQPPVLQQGPNLGFISVVSECGPFIDVPVLFSQSETSDISSLSLEIAFDPKIFEDVFTGPNNPQNRPQAVPGLSLESEWGRHFQVFFSRAEEQGVTVPGRWKIEVLPDGILSGMKLPVGELLRLRFYANAWSMPGGYEIAIRPESVRFYNTIGASIDNLVVQSGTITLIRCPLPTITIVTTTTTTVPVTTTTLGPPQPVVFAGDVISNCGPYVEMPVFFMQPENSVVSAVAVEVSFPTDVFHDQYFAPNDERNLPQVLPGWSLSAWAGYPLMMVSQRAIRSNHTPVAGNWTVSITPMQNGPRSGIRSGEIFRMRLFPKPGAPLGEYTVSISPYSAFYNRNGSPIHGLTVRGGRITMVRCPVP